MRKKHWDLRDPDCQLKTQSSSKKTDSANNSENNPVEGKCCLKLRETFIFNEFN